MPTTLSATPIELITLDVPADTEAVDSASVILYAQPLLNGVDWCGARIGELRALVPGSDPVENYTIWLPITAALRAGNFALTIATSPKPVLVDAGTAGSFVLWDLNAYLPADGHIVAFSIYVIGTTGHSALPANMPRATLSRSGTGAGGSSITPVETNIANVSDTSANVTAYELVHVIGTAGLTEHIDNSQQYFLRIEGESGANALNNFAIGGVLINVSG